MLNLPSDVLSQILCRLAVDCLLRLRCVSKSWRALIDTPEFAKLHVNHSLKTNSNSNLCVMLREAEYYTKDYGKRCFYSVGFDSLNSPVVKPKQLTNPLKSLEFNTNILGSCNGLLLISNTVNDIALWNPTTGKFKRIPVPPKTGENHDGVKFGFGYDVVKNDYKVVRIVQFSGSEKGSFRSDVKVYSLRSNLWKGVEEFPYYLRYKDESGTYLNGSLHWVASSKMENPANHLLPLIIAFDLGTDKCRVVPRPPFWDTGFIMKLVVLGGSLCTYHSYCVDYYDEYSGNTDFVLDHMDVWEMTEYGVKESWRRVVSLEQPEKSVANTLVPVAYSNSRDEILLEQHNVEFLWTNVKTGSTKIVQTEVDYMPRFLRFNSHVCLRSLVQPCSVDGKSGMKKQYNNNQDKTGKGGALKKRGDDFLSKGFKLKL